MGDGDVGANNDDRERRRRGVLIVAVVGAVALLGVGVGVLIAEGGDSDERPEVLLERSSEPGPNPFTPPIDPKDPAEAATVVGAVPASGASPAAGEPLYGGSGDARVCDVEALIGYLERNEAKGRAWAETVGVGYDRIAAYIRALTPTVLLYDTRVTNHGFSGGRATPRQSVLQAGTAVLVDESGKPIAKCKCGNPLRPPVPTHSKPDYVGKPWPGFEPEAVITVGTTPTTAPEGVDPRKIYADAALKCRFTPGGSPYSGSASWQVTETSRAGVFEVRTQHMTGMTPVSSFFATWAIDVKTGAITPLDDRAKQIVSSCPAAFEPTGEPRERREEAPEQPPGGATDLLVVESIRAVEPGTGASSAFTLDQRTRIVWIRTYHWFGGGGLGTIALRAEGGTLYGPWSATGYPGQGGRENAYWVVAPNVALPPGTYEVVDSDPSTWSQNAETGGRGIVSVYGKPAR